MDICKRNGKNKLIWLGDKDKTLNYTPKSGEMILTVHRWFANKSCPGNWMYARMGDLAEKVTAQLGSGTDGKGGTTTSQGTQASAFSGKSEADVVKSVGTLFTADQKKTGILASVSMAQFILESGYGKSELAQNANNVFGMKCSLSGNTWSGSTWDGKSKYTKQTKEQNADVSYTTITADFRKYSNVEDSIADHSAYLLGAKNGSKLRYDGLKGCTDYKKAAQIIKDGGYATSLTYVQNLCSIIERWNLTQFDVKETETAVACYRVRKTWADSKTQKGAYKILENAKKCADANPGYSVFDVNGVNIYTPKTTAPAASADVPFLVQVSISDLNIRKGPGTDYARTQYIPVGVYTIKALYLKALRILGEERDEIISTFEAVKDEMYDTSELEKEQAALQQEVMVVTELVEQCISENAHVAQNQKNYQKKYDALSDRYDRTKERLDKVSARIMECQAKREMIETFLHDLAEMDEDVHEFTDDLWFNLLDHVTVFSKKDVRFTFKNGTEISVK